MTGAPPALAGGALALHLLDEPVGGELAQVVAGRATALADDPPELAGGRGPVEAELPQQPVAERMRQRAQCAHVGHLDGGLERGLIDRHGTTLGVQRLLCKGSFALPIRLTHATAHR